MVARICQPLLLRSSRASSTPWLRSWKHANVQFARKIKRRKPLHLRLRHSNETNRMRNFRDCGKRISLKTSDFLKWLVSEARERSRTTNEHRVNSWASEEDQRSNRSVD